MLPFPEDAIGQPQWGQAGAREETCLAHSGQVISAMVLLLMGTGFRCAGGDHYSPSFSVDQASFLLLISESFGSTRAILRRRRSRGFTGFWSMGFVFRKFVRSSQMLREPCWLAENAGVSAFSQSALWEKWRKSS